MEILGKVKLREDYLREREITRFKNILYPYSVIDEIYKVYYSDNLKKFKTFSSDNFKKRFEVFLQPCITVEQHFRHLYEASIKAEFSSGQRVDDYSFLIVRKGERRTVKVPQSTRSSAVRAVQRESRGGQLFIKFMNRWILIS